MVFDHMRYGDGNNLEAIIMERRVEESLYYRTANKDRGGIWYITRAAAEFWELVVDQGKFCYVFFKSQARVRVFSFPL